MRQQHLIDPVTCIGCELCVVTCPTGAIGDLDGKLVIEDSLCDGCGTCLDLCPSGSIRNWVEIGERAPYSIAEQAAWLQFPESPGSSSEAEVQRAAA